MLRASQILVRTLALAASAAAFAGCGQRGPLYLPTDPAASQRATLPQTLDPMRDTPVPTPIVPAPPAPSPSRPASSPTP
ncbi:LPS translocon maturation chaperone LptM [Paracidovorax valerianellae]|uniref:LPS translocon maturation chaperone LptM n=1 Tax=Paracidovorax valerianellae TaxID=187868 RepID=UPI000B877999|nr:lipoprotein [Paracidovorax valerianellae]MDA8445542.1 lipoprotein [Paracidovorax valerianellae]